MSRTLRLALVGVVLAAVVSLWARPWEGGQPQAAPSPVAVGLDARPTAGDADLARQAGARVVRVEFPVGAPAGALAETIDGYARLGIQVLPLAGFHARLPSTGEARNVGGWARAFGPGSSFWRGRDRRLAVRAIEFGNETSFTHQFGDRAGEASYRQRARVYAQRFRSATQAVAAADRRVGVLAQADDGGTGSSAWVDTLFETVPDLASRAAGWTVHPYGPDWRRRMDDLVSHTDARGGGGCRSTSPNGGSRPTTAAA